MNNILRKIGFFIVSVSLTAVIFWLVYMDKQSKTDALNYTLSLLGEKFVAMVAEGQDRDAIRTKYQNVLQRANDRELSPEQIEYLTANILNLSNRDTTISEEQAEAVLEWSLAAPEIDKKYQAEKETENGEPETSADRWRETGERIKRIYNINNKLTETIKAKGPEAPPKMKRDVKFQVIGDKLTVTIDTDLKNKLYTEKLKHLNEELEKLEESQIVVWQDSLDIKIERSLAEQQYEYAIKLEKLKDTEADIVRIMESLTKLPDLQPMIVTPNFKLDSIEIKAGIYIESNADDTTCSTSK